MSSVRDSDLAIHNPELSRLTLQLAANRIKAPVGKAKGGSALRQLAGSGGRSKGLLRPSADFQMWEMLAYVALKEALCTAQHQSWTVTRTFTCPR